jgi:hypothetical protein
MCFSAKASFIASAALIVVGIATLKKASTRSELLLAAVPCLFGIQQFFEGVIWQSLGNPAAPSNFSTISEYIYLFFACVLWPIWVPLSLGVVEKIDSKRTIIWVCLFVGILLSGYYLVMLQQHPLNVHVMRHSIQYSADFDPWRNIYLAVTFIPLVVSSYRNIRWLSFFVIIGFFVADYFYRETYISVWCFFSAISSLILYFIVRSHSLAKNSNTETSS